VYIWHTWFASKVVPAVAPTQNVSVSTQQTTPKYKHTRIADIKVGERVVTSTDVTPQPTQVDLETWKQVTLYAEETWYDGTVDSINVVTLVPPEWIALHDAKVGNLVPIPLDLQEMGLDENLLAKVQAIERCPEIRAGPGRVVLTTVNHLSYGICNLTYTTQDGKSETIRPTITHRFYSLDRNEWIHIGDARFGEKLQGLGNAPINIVSVIPLGGTERVYNMTVEDEHVYHVGYLNLLAHNNCPISPNFFRRVKNSHQGQNMSPYERDFVKEILQHKPNLQIYRTTDGKGLGDFLIVDMSNAKKHTGYLVELKMSSGSPQAGHQLRYYEYVPEAMPKLGLPKPPEPMTGTIEEIMAKIIHIN
jgi:hypothetical protein